jgi:hypothetical protein
MTTDSPAAILYSSDGYELAVQAGTAISADSRELLFSGSDGSAARIIAVDSLGRVKVTGVGSSGTPDTGVITIQGIGGGTPVPISGTISASNPSVSTTGTAPPASATYIGGSVTTSAPSYTTGQMNALSLTTSGALRIDGYGTTQQIAGTVTANAGTGNFSVVGTNSDNTTNSTSKLPVIAALASNASPTWSDGNMVPLSVGTSGNLRIAGTVQPGNTPNTVPWLTTINQGGNSAVVSSLGALRIDGYGTAGSPAGGVLSVQGVTGGIPFFTKNKEVATFTALATSTSPGNNKSMWSIQNANGSSVTLKIHEIHLINVQTTSVTGVVVNFELRRATSHASGTAITSIEAMDTNDSLNANITVRTNATITGESTKLLWRCLWSSDEWGVGSTDVESYDHVFQTMFPIYSRKTNDTKPITLNANECLTIKCATNTTVGSFDIMVVFTQE